MGFSHATYGDLWCGVEPATREKARTQKGPVMSRADSFRLAANRRAQKRNLARLRRASRGKNRVRPLGTRVNAVSPGGDKVGSLLLPFFLRGLLRLLRGRETFLAIFFGPALATFFEIFFAAFLAGAAAGRYGLAVVEVCPAEAWWIAHDTQRAPGASLSATARAEIDYLLRRLASHDPRAAF